MSRIVGSTLLVFLLADNVLSIDNPCLAKVNNARDVGGLIELESRAVHYGSNGVVVLNDHVYISKTATELCL